MSQSNRCSECGAELPASAPRGLCPACLLKRGLEMNTVGYTPAFSAPAGAARAGWNPPEVQELAAQFPDLEVLELIGRGGMGAVYKARQKNLDRLVALKVLPPEIGRDPAFAERFTREAQALARLNHPHIVAIYDFGQREGLYFFLMEYVDGLSLRQLLDAGTVSSREALAIVPQICEALQFAHDHGIVHRDIKPENILVNRQGQVKIADFGLAKLTGRTPEGDTKVMGTPRYMAPEQLERPEQVDHRADIYSLGVVFYQMLTGELPRGRLEGPSKRVLIDVRLDEVVLRALEREPERRYQQASEIKTQVETILQGRGHSVEPRRHGTVKWGQAAVAALLAVAGAAIYIPIALLTLATDELAGALYLDTPWYNVLHPCVRVTYYVPFGLAAAELLHQVMRVLLERTGRPRWLMSHAAALSASLRLLLGVLLPCFMIWVWPRSPDAPLVVYMSIVAPGGAALAVILYLTRGSAGGSGARLAVRGAGRVIGEVVLVIAGCYAAAMATVYVLQYAHGPLERYSLVIAVAIALAAMCEWSRWTAFVRLRRACGGLCLVCGYDLRASRERCPECGTPVGAALYSVAIPESSQVSPAGEPRSPWLHLLGILFGRPLKSPLAITLANLAALVLLGLLASLGYLPVSERWRSFGFAALFYCLGYVGFFYLFDTIGRKRGARKSANSAGPGGAGRSVVLPPQHVVRAPANAFAVMYALFIAFLIWSRSQLPAEIATHFDGEGRPNGWMSRTAYLIFVTGLPLAMAALFWVLAALTPRMPAHMVRIPRADYWMAPERRGLTAKLMLGYLLWLSCILVGFFAALHGLTILANRKMPVHLPMGGLLTVTILFFTALMTWMAAMIARFASAEHGPGGAGAGVSRPGGWWRAIFWVLLVVLVAVTAVVLFQARVWR